MKKNKGSLFFPLGQKCPNFCAIIKIKEDKEWHAKREVKTKDQDKRGR